MATKQSSPVRCLALGFSFAWALRLARVIIIALRATCLGLRVEGGEIFGDCSRLALLLSPVEFLRRLAVIAAGIRLQHTGIDGKAFALDEAVVHCRAHDALEDMAQYVAPPKAAKPVHRKRRVMWDCILEIEFAEPAIGQMQIDLLDKAVVLAKSKSGRPVILLSGSPKRRSGGSTSRLRKSIEGNSEHDDHPDDYLLNVRRDVEQHESV